MKKNTQYQFAKNCFIFCLLLISFSISANAQNDSLISGQKSQSGFTSDTSKINQINKQAHIYLVENSLEKGHEYAKNALSLSLNSSFHMGMAEAYESIGQYYYFSNVYRQAILYFIL